MLSSVPGVGVKGWVPFDPPVPSKWSNHTPVKKVLGLVINDLVGHDVPHMVRHSNPSPRSFLGVGKGGFMIQIKDWFPKGKLEVRRDVRWDSMAGLMRCHLDGRMPGPVPDGSQIFCSKEPSRSRGISSVKEGMSLGL